MSESFTIPTFAQYVHKIHEAARNKYNLSWTEVSEELPEHNYRREYHDYLVKAYENGGTITSRHWNSLHKDIQFRLKRTHRYLSN